jgi:hypothetical protein
MVNLNLIKNKSCINESVVLFDTTDGANPSRFSNSNELTTTKKSKPMIMMTKSVKIYEFSFHALLT